MCAVPSRLVFTFNSTFLSFFNLCSSTYFRYTLAFSTGVLFSPPDTSIVTRDIKSDLPARALGSDSCAACVHRPPQSAMVANATQTAILICGFMLERKLRRCNLSSTDCSRRSSLPPLSLMPTSGCALLRSGSPSRVENAFCPEGLVSEVRPSGQCSTVGKLSQNLLSLGLTGELCSCTFSESTRQETAVA